MGREVEEQQGAAAMPQPGRVPPPPPRDKSSFAATCTLLSQYLKDNKAGLHGLGGLAMAPPPPPGAFRPPTTMNLLSALDSAPAEDPNDDAAEPTAEEPRRKDHDQRTGENASDEAADDGEGAQQLTIIYAGKVVVFDKFPSTKVKDLLQIASTGGDAVDRASAAAPAAPNLPTPSQNTLSGNNSDLPIARRNSLHRFLEKRKDRITAKAPYQVTSSSAGVEAPPKQQAAGVEKPWLGLGQEVTVKQVM